MTVAKSIIFVLVLSSLAYSTANTLSHVGHVPLLITVMYQYVFGM